MDKLNIDEVLALQMLGLSTSKILKTDLDVFNRLFDEHPELDEWLEEINDKLDGRDANSHRKRRLHSTSARTISAILIAPSTMSE